MTLRKENRDVPVEMQTELQIRLFGPLEVRYGGETVPLRSGKAGAVLALLVLRGGREVKREWIAETLWPDAVGGEGLVNLRQRLADLRRALGLAAARLVAPSSRTLRFDAAEDEVDLLVFDRAVARGDSASLRKAIALYNGPLLEDYTEYWAQGEREARQQTYLKTLETVARQAIADGSAETASDFLQRGATIDLFHQSLHRLLMQAHAARENWEAALQVYTDLRRALLSLHGVEPERETTRLYQEFRTKARGPAPAAMPAQTLSAEPPCRIPYPLTTLIGREAELRELGAHLLTARLVTLTGMGGSGKTRLALEAARDLNPMFPDGSCFADLSGTTEEHQISQTVAAALGIPGGPRASWTELLRDFLRSRHLLLVLDNCEHLLTGCRELARRLLSDCTYLRILATSRQPLELIGEVVLPIPPLRLPHEDLIGREFTAASTAGAEGIAAGPAVQLFTERARAVRPDLEFTPRNSGTVNRICHLMDGLPLALEIAAGLASVLTLEEIADFLPANRLPVPARSGDPSSRHASLLTVLDASYALLTWDEQRLFSRLSVFAGNWTLEAAADVTADRGKALSADNADNADRVHRFHRFSQSNQEVAGQARMTAAASHQLPTTRTEALATSHQSLTTMSLLRGLIAKSLVVVETAEDVSRYRMLETVREYAARRLEEQRETTEIRTRHQQFYSAFATRAEHELTGPNQAQWLHRLQAEQSNLRAALNFGLQGTGAGSINDPAFRALRADRPPDGKGAGDGELSDPGRHPAVTTVQNPLRSVTTALRTAVALGRFWQIRGHFGEGRDILQLLLDATQEDGDTMDRADAMGWAALLAIYQSDYTSARRHAAAARESWERMGDRRGLAGALGVQALVAKDTGVLPEARRLFEASRDAAADSGHRIAEASALGYLGIVAHNLSQWDVADDYYRASLDLRRGLDDRWGIAASLNNLALLARDCGDNQAAKTLLEESIALRRELDDRRSLAVSLNVLGKLYGEEGDFPRSEERLAESLRLCRALGDRRSVAYSMEHYASLAMQRQQWERAARLYGGADALRAAISAPLPPDAVEEREAALFRLRKEMGTSEFETAWGVGRRSDLETLVAEV